MLSARSSSRVGTVASVVAAAVLVVAVDGLSISAAAATPGSLIWSSRYNGPESLYDQANADAVSPDGTTVFVTGSVHSFTDRDYATVAYDASTGAVRWTKRYNGPASNADSANAIAVSPDGSTVFVTGSSYSTTFPDYATVAYDASSGETLWTKRYDGPGDGYDETHAIGVSPNGAKVFVTGNSAGSTDTRDYATIAYATSTGARSWVKRYDATDLDDVAKTLAVSPDGSTVFVSGYSHRKKTGYDVATVAYGTGTGVERWVQRYDDLDSWDEGRSIGVAPDSSTVFVTGVSSSSTTGFDYATIAYDAASGAPRWSKLYDGPGDANDQANALAVSPDGSSVFVTGRSYSTLTGDDYATIAYDASTGGSLWTKRYVGAVSTSSEEARDVGVRPDSSTVIVTGYSYGPTTSNDYATVAYDGSTGAKLWAKRYAGPSTDPGLDVDAATALDVSASAVFVTGYSYGSATGFDYATVAYALA
jgi:hypothetical protein